MEYDEPDRRKKEQERREDSENSDKSNERRPSAHDDYIHAMLDDGKFVARFLNSYLPEKIRDVLDFSDPSKIEIHSTIFYDETLKKHIADFIFLVPFKNSAVYAALRLIAEHKAQSGASIDRKTVAQTLRYLSLDVANQLRDLKSGDVLCQPLVVVFYTGADPDFETPSWESCFPLPELLQVEEFQESQVRYKPVSVNLTRMFLEDKLSKEDFLYVMVAAMARASLGRLSESYATLFNALGNIKNWTDADDRRLKTTISYIAASAERPTTREDIATLISGANNEETRKHMRTVLDDIRDEGRDEGWRDGMRDGEIKGKIEGKIETIQTVASMRFQENLDHLNSLLTKLDDLNLLEQIRQFVMTAASLFDVEKFADFLLQFRSKPQNVVNEQAL